VSIIKTSGYNPENATILPTDARNMINEYLSGSNEIPELRKSKTGDKGLTGRGEIKSHLLKLVKEGRLNGPDIDKLTSKLKDKVGIDASAVGAHDITNISIMDTADDTEAGGDEASVI
jgi:hypothetical protein